MNAVLADPPPASSLAAVPVAREHLRPLTSLRFVAAAMVVLLHSCVMFPFSANWGEPLNLSEGVTFFFVLSGFILTYAYPQLDEAGVRRFLVARVARLWPAHAVTTLVMLIPIAAGVWDRPPDNFLPAALTTLAMVHSWVPFFNSYFAFNSPSWSVSTEVAFYLLFPLLLWNWRHTWHVKLLTVLVLHLGLVRLSVDVLALPITAPDRDSVDLAGVLNASPLGTLYQFVMGMVAALVWRAAMPRLRLGVAVATVLECAALVVCVWTLAARPWFPLLFEPLGPWLGRAWLAWLPPIPLSVFAFATLIVLGAFGRGLLSRLLSFGPFVMLGQISYSVYLIHLPIIFAYGYLGRPLIGGLPDPVEYAVYWLATLVSAWLLWRYVERPMRRAIRNWYARHEHTLTDRQWRLVGAGITGLVVAILGVHVATFQ